MRIGILGSSFNPPHEGHLKLSKKALDIFELDQIWWLITKKNPLKNEFDYMNFFERKSKIESMIDKQSIILKYFEEESKSNFLIDNLQYIKKTFPKNEYIFLMGSDSFIEINKWKSYEDIFNKTYLAVFNRNSSKESVNSSKAGIEYERFKLEEPSKNIFNNELPCWTFISDFNIKISSSDMRKNIEL